MVIKKAPPMQCTSETKRKGTSMSNDFRFLMYQSAEENMSINAIIKDETIWLSQKGMAELFGVPLTAEQMIRLAAQVGSDVPFFIDGRPTLVTGRGEILAPVAGSPIGHRLVIVKPDESVSTAEAYAGVAPARPESRLGDLFGLPLRQWKGRIVNDFETSVFRIHPTIAAIKEELYRAGALYASMSGSGSAVYGIFEERTPDLPAFEGMFVYQEDMI